MRVTRILESFTRMLQNQSEQIHPQTVLHKHNKKLTRKNIVEKIKTNNSLILDLSGYDLSYLDLSNLDLRSVNFSRCRLNNSNLANCNLRNTNFEESNCRGVDFSGSELISASFLGAFLSNANFTNASLFRADLMRADFRDAILLNTNLHLANLERASRLTAESLGYRIMQENAKTYENFHRWILRYRDIDDLEARIARYSKRRLRDGLSVAQGLKILFTNNGQYADASWAYIKERQFKKQMHSLGNARINFRREFPDQGRYKKIRQLGFYLKHFYFWVLDWIAELTCGYGERPLRPIFLAALTLFTFPGFYALSGGVVSEGGQMTWLDYFNYSFATFTTLGFNQFSAVTPLAQTISSIEGLVGISILALLMFVLGNRISRA